MPLTVYMSCLDEDRDAGETRRFCEQVKKAGGVLNFPPVVTWDSERHAETSVERCDVFVAVLGKYYADSSQRRHELEYAYALQCARTERRPTLLILPLATRELPEPLRHISVRIAGDPDSLFP